MKRNNDKLLDVIIGAIEESGVDADGYRAAGISKATFRRWMMNDATFRSRVEAARAHYQSHSLPQLRKHATRGLARVLKAAAEGLELVTTTSTEALDRDGRVVTLETVTRKPVMVPIQQAFAYVMGKEADLLVWVSQGVMFGFFSPDFLDSVNADIDGLKGRIQQRLDGRMVVQTAPASSPTLDRDLLVAALGIPGDYEADPVAEASATIAGSLGIVG